MLKRLYTVFSTAPPTTILKEILFWGLQDHTERILTRVLPAFW